MYHEWNLLAESTNLFDAQNLSENGDVIHHPVILLFSIFFLICLNYQTKNP